MKSFDFGQKPLARKADRPYNAAPMDTLQTRPKIAVTVGTNVKSSRDQCTGLLRYVMEHSLAWDIRFFHRAETQTETELRQSLLKWRPDGLIVCAWGGMTPFAARALRPFRRIAAFTYGELHDAALPERAARVTVDDRAVCDAAFSMLARRGLQHFAYVHTGGGELERRRSAFRAEQFAAAASAAGFRSEDFGDRDDPEHWTAATSALAARLSALPKPCGIMAYNDETARRVVDACNLAGLRMPEQIQIVGVDNDEALCENLRPRLTSVEPDFEGAGAALAARMREMLAADPADAAAERRPPDVCGVRRVAERDSTLDLSGASRLVTAAQKIIDSRACEGLSPETLAASLHVSRRLLSLRFREVRGEGVAEAIRKRKLEEVCRQLRETDRPIGVIADMCGFPVLSHFCAAFGRAYGCSPRAWRSREARE